MRVLVTGANGFLGSAIVEALLTAGHRPVALVRPSADLTGVAWERDVDVVRGDLRQPQHVEALGTLDAVIHAAAGTSGGLPEQTAASVVATENLFGLLDASSLARFVHVSSFSVYDFESPPAGSTIRSDTTPTEPEPRRRDAYTAAKLAQEQLVQRWANESGVELVVVRPGAIYGPGKTWAWGSVGSIGPFDLVPSPHAAFRLIHVDHCAAALVAALTAPDAPGIAIDLVDDELPTHLGFHRTARRAGAPVGRAVPIPWWAMRTLGSLVGAVARAVAGPQPKLPEIVDGRRQAARWKPFEYDAAPSMERLGWRPARSTLEAIEDTVAAEHGQASA